MPKFNLDDYETVESRLKRFFEAYPDGRIITDWANSDAYQEGPKTWVVKTTIYLDAGDQANGLAKATGYASETDGTGGANSAGAALENCETSSIGRGLANLGLSGNRRASREEMQKVERVAQHATDYLAIAKGITDVAELRKLYTKAKADGARLDVLEELKQIAGSLDTGSEDSGAGRSNPRIARNK
jgi:hypothetical protein